MPELASALRTRRGQLTLALEEVALRVPAAEAERDPVAERLPALLLDPVAFGAFGHLTRSDCSRWSGPAGAFVRVKATLARGRETTHGRT